MVKKSEDHLADEEEVIDYSPASDKPVRGMWMSVFATFVITWLIMIAGGIYLHGEIQNGSGSESGDEDVKSEIAKLQKTIDTLAGQVSTNKSLADKISPLEEKIAAIPDDFPGRAVFGDPVDDIELSDLRKQLENLEGKVEENLDIKSSQDDKMSPLVIATINLRDRVSKGLSFDSDLSILKDLGRNDSVMIGYLGKVEKSLNAGLPEIDTLKSRFSALAGKVVATSKTGNNEDFWDKTLVALSDSVTVRKVGMVEGNTVEALVARAELDVMKGNIGKALETLSGIDGKASKPLQSWLDDAKRYADVEKIFSDMYNHVTRLAASNASSML